MDRLALHIALLLTMSGCSTLAALTGDGAPARPRAQPRPATALATPEHAATRCAEDGNLQYAEATRCCERGSAAWCFSAGAPRTRPVDERARLLSRACALDELQACSLLGTDDDLVKAHPEQARLGLQKACTGGQQAACDRAGLLLAQAKLGVVSRAEKVALARLACEAGRQSKQVLKVHHYACVAYGNALWEGHTVAQNRPLALQILSASCDDVLVPTRMQIDCHTRIARAYRDGEATSQDPQQAAARFSRACSLSGTAQTCLEYAQTCDDALFGYERDGDHEPACYASACQAGSAAACETMGGYFQAWDLWEKAAKAYGAAVALGAASARPRLEEVVVKLGRQRERDRIHAAGAIEGLLAQCRSNRSKVEQARVALFSARSRADIEGIKRAVGELKNLDGPWSEALTKLQDAIAVASNGSGDERVRLLLLVDAQCNCRPTTTGRCR